MPSVDFAKKAVVKVQQRSAFDKSFRNLLTTKCGTLTPLLCDEVIPNTTVNLKLAISATLPPLASETFMNVNLKAEAFFIPTRLIMPGWSDFVQGNDTISYAGSDYKLRVPVIPLTYNGANTAPYLGRGTLADYLGMRSVALVQNEVVNVNALPFLAYHFLYDSWYRNSLVQNSIYDDNNYITPSAAYNLVSSLYHKPCDASAVGYTLLLGSTYRDGVHLGDLRQRNFGSDYFTVATPSPQKGVAQKISMNLPSNITIGYSQITSADPYQVATNIYVPLDSESTVQSSNSLTGEISTNGFEDGYGDPVGLSFTIASLRAANSLQQWCERQNLANGRYQDYLKVNYNADLSDSIAQRPVYLGSASFPVYSKGVYQTAADSNSGNNPFDSVGSRYGHAYSEGNSFIIDHYTTQEHGYIMVLVSLVPEVTYSSGVPTYLQRYCDASSYGEVANPLLQNVGAQPIKCSELDSYYYDDSQNAVFGYTDRFADWMTRPHELHGLLSDGGSLQSFALQRSFAQAPTGMLQISSAFLQIPTNYMDQVTAVDSAISTYGCWIDSYLDYKVVMPLAKYSVPSLQDPAYEHGDSVSINRRGRVIE